MIRSHVVCFIVGFCFVSLSTLAGAAAGDRSAALSTGDGLGLTFGESGEVSGLAVSGKALPANGAGGFFIREFPKSNAYQPLPLRVEESDGGLRLEGALADQQIQLDARFEALDDCIEAAGEIADLSGADRPIYLEFRLPVAAAGWRWWDSINATRAVGAGEPCESNLVPIPAVAGPDAGLAMAIPPDEPCVFQCGCNESGLWLRWAFGLTKETAKFLSKARFRFRIFRVDPRWGFRDALARYYDWNRTYYELPAGQMKNWTHNQSWVHGGDVTSRKVADPSATGLMAYLNLLGRIQDVEVTPEKIASPSGLKELIDQCVKFHWHFDDPTRGREVLLNSALWNPDGSIMTAGVSGDSIDFPLNASPSLFADRPDAPTHGRFMVEYVKGLFEGGHINSVHFDTVGRWGRYLNYRRDHFRYADHPLTFDNQGRVCLYNKISIYEMFAELRAFCREHGMRVEGAGMKAYEAKWQEPFFDEMKGIPGDCVLPGIESDGRWFTGALVDSGWHEGNLNEVALTGYDFEREVVGRKSYRISSGNTYKHNPKAGPSEEEVRQALAQNTAWGMGIPLCSYYWKKPGEDGYCPTHALCERDKALWDRYIPANDAIREAGWQPVTHAEADSREVICERFGAKPPYYFTLWGPAPPATVRLVVETGQLGLDAGAAAVSELIEETPIKSEPQGAALVLEIPMKKDYARVIRVQ
ncbi:MAG: hypothetical protein NTW86_21245 [Candidatus Sumerlaeota bacterium]|nr:hypothetical protein [Candidatus Sumerlaeota bacterium]